MTLKKCLVIASILIAPVLLHAQNVRSLDPAEILKPLGAEWLTHNGDYSGRRHSSLTQINQSTVKNLTLAWFARFTSGSGPRMITGGRGAGDFPPGSVSFKSSALMVDGVIYISSPDNAWAVDGSTGREIWHYFWKTRGGTHIGNRGLGMWKNYVYMETPDNYLVCLDAKTGQEKWNVEIAKLEEQYFSTPAPVIIDDHVIVGTGNDMDRPGVLQSFNAETGKLEWKLYTVPMNVGDPGLETWESLDAARHGGGNAWVNGAYDPETKLYIFSTGNPNPAYTPGARDGDNLFTSSMIAVHVDTGKMAWYFQTSPNDAHDWDSAQTPVIFDGTINGQARKLVATAARNGYYFVVDRVTGQHITTMKYGSTTNWSTGLTPKGAPLRNRIKDPAVGGSLVSPTADGTINWQPPAFSPDTGYLYVAERNGFSIFYLLEQDPRGSMGLGGSQEVTVGSAGAFLTAIDYRNGGRIAWRHRYPTGANGGGGGILSTAGGLVFAGDGNGNLVAHNASTGAPLWHTRIGPVGNAPQTWMIDGRQYLVAATGDTLWAFVLY